MRYTIPLLAFMLLLCASVHSQDNPEPAVPSLTYAEADNRLAIANRMLQGGIYDRALELADSVLNHPDLQAQSVAGRVE